MIRQIVITEKAGQAKDVRTAMGSRYGAILTAEGHLLADGQNAAFPFSICRKKLWQGMSLPSSAVLGYQAMRDHRRNR